MHNACSREETLAVLGDSKELAALKRGLADLDVGRIATLEDMKADLARRA
jgi:predicted transcriptional regulator